MSSTKPPTQSCTAHPRASFASTLARPRHPATSSSLCWRYVAPAHLTKLPLHLPTPISPASPHLACVYPWVFVPRFRCILLSLLFIARMMTRPAHGQSTMLPSSTALSLTAQSTMPPPLIITAMPTSAALPGICAVERRAIAMNVDLGGTMGRASVLPPRHLPT
ncbi:hypothetical protein BOTBODRAFT_184992 [Botryobasidium botryosum FD-172 SS1]|uniref:Uncharacterized protein n=1 Tax=Botryobasidium botryosum (strain FD-172 SS1) TaxID=930990 RepID=A0A067N2K8_BOTB1|nr:hypothetical protein BOTBODRAFT_184992 [Botryobasidium botryosum FD-172 SS1]